MLTKMKVIQTIARLPEKFSFDELLGEMIRIEEEKNHDSGKDPEDNRPQESFHWFG